jgi:hypothetical protein
MKNFKEFQIKKIIHQGKFQNLISFKMKTLKGSLANKTWYLVWKIVFIRNSEDIFQYDIFKSGKQLNIKISMIYIIHLCFYQKDHFIFIKIELNSNPS